MQYMLLGASLRLSTCTSIIDTLQSMLQLNHENESEELLLDSSVNVKETRSDNHSEWIYSMHGN